MIELREDEHNEGGRAFIVILGQSQLMRFVILPKRWLGHIQPRSQAVYGYWYRLFADYDNDYVYLGDLVRALTDYGLDVTPVLDAAKTLGW